MLFFHFRKRKKQWIQLVCKLMNIPDYDKQNTIDFVAEKLMIALVTVDVDIKKFRDALHEHQSIM